MVRIFKSESGKTKVLSSYDELLTGWKVDYQEVDIDTSYGSTHCIIAGDQSKPALLLLHGVGDNSAVMWILNIQQLSQHFYCIALDTLGGPGKSIPNSSYNKHDFDQVNWITEVADGLDLNQFNIAGVSNGAYMAFNYTVHKPDRVHAVVCMEGGMIVAPIKAMLQTLSMMFPEMLLPTRHNLLKILSKLSSPDSRVFEQHPILADHLILLMKNHNQQAMTVHKLQKYDREATTAIKDKFYFLLGAHKLEHKEDLIAIFKDGDFRYKVIEQAGHGINHEQPDLINEEIKQFLLREQ